MAIIEIQRAFDPDSPTRPLPYENLAQIARKHAADALVSEQTREAAMRLFEQYYKIDEPSAAGCIEVMELALAFGGVVRGIAPEAPVCMSDLWAAGLLHDVGKTKLGPLIRHSNQSIWSERHARLMQRHSRFGHDFIIDAGLGKDIARPVAQHHSLQDEPYGMGFELTDTQAITCRGVVFGDFTDAMLGRNNSRNADLGYEERIGLVGDKLIMLLVHSALQGKKAEIHAEIMENVAKPYAERKFVPPGR